jgi:hypothetical protein
MPRKKLRTEDAPDVFDEAIAAQDAAKGQEVVQQGAPPAAAMPAEQPVAGQIANPSSTPRESADGHAEVEALPRKKWTPAENPRGWERNRTPENLIRLLNSEDKQTGKGAWVIRFEKPPNEMKGYSKENRHPVFQMLKDEGFRFGFDPNDGNPGWGKPYTGDAYGQDHIEARRVFQKAAEMIGAKVEQGAQVS